jgi:hypothetical protein
VIDSIEEFFQIEIDHPSVALRDVLLGLSHGIMRRPPRSEPIAVLGERRVPLPLQNLHHRLLDQKIAEGDDVRKRVVALRTAAAAERDAKPPWKGQLLKGRGEGWLLFRTAISRNVIPFALVDPPLVLLPVIVEDDAPTKFKVLSAEGLLEQGQRYASAWFFDAESRWDKNKTDKNKEMGTGLSRYLDWQSKLSQQNPKARYLVLYTSSATDASATVIDRRSFDHPFIVDHMTYWCECGEAEAHYLAAYINSGYANAMIKEFQSRGLFGPRHIHKLIVSNYSRLCGVVTRV